MYLLARRTSVNLRSNYLAFHVLNLSQVSHNAQQSTHKMYATTPLPT